MAGSALAAQVVSGRQVGSGKEIATSFARACGSQAWNAVLSATSGSTITSERTGRPPVPGLHDSIVPSSERTRGATRSMWLTPRRQAFQVP